MPTDKKHSAKKTPKSSGRRRRQVVEEAKPVENTIDLGLYADNLVQLFKTASNHGLVESVKTIDFSSIEPEQVVKIAEAVAEAVAASDVSSPKARAAAALALFQFKRIDAAVASESEGFLSKELSDEAIAQLNTVLDNLFFSVHAINPSVDALMDNVSSFLKTTLQIDPATVAAKMNKARETGPAPVDPMRVDEAKGSLSEVLGGLPAQLKNSSTFSSLAERIGGRLAEIRPELILDAKQDMDDKKVVEKATEEHKGSVDLIKGLFPGLGNVDMPKISADDIQSVIQELSGGQRAEDGGGSQSGAKKSKKPTGKMQMDEVLSMLGAHSSEIQNIVKDIGDDMKGRVARKELSQEDLKSDLQGVMAFLGQMGLGGALPGKK